MTASLATTTPLALPATTAQTKGSTTQAQTGVIQYTTIENQEQL